MMRELISSFPEQLQLAWKNADATEFKNTDQQVSNVVITGLGGSGIGGKIIAQLVQDDAVLPILINNDYSLPAFVNEHTLVVVSSYSGNTEETVSAMKSALNQGAVVACITSGGMVANIAREHQLDSIIVPGGQPPRSQFGYSAISLLKVLTAYDVIPSHYFTAAHSLGNQLASTQDSIIHRASRICDRIENRMPIIYAEARNEGVAIRWRQQFNENSKLLCWHHVYPEMNHNELVGWEKGSSDYVALLLRTDDDNPRTTVRMDITEPMFLAKGATVENVVAQGD